MGIRIIEVPLYINKAIKLYTALEAVKFSPRITQSCLQLLQKVLHFYISTSPLASCRKLFNSEGLGVCKHSSKDLVTVPECVKLELRLENDLSVYIYLLCIYPQIILMVTVYCYIILSLSLGTSLLCFYFTYYTMLQCS